MEKENPTAVPQPSAGGRVRGISVLHEATEGTESNREFNTKTPGRRGVTKFYGSSRRERRSVVIGDCRLRIDWGDRAGTLRNPQAERPALRGQAGVICVHGCSRV